MNWKSHANVIFVVLVTLVLSADCGTFKIKSHGSFQYEALVVDTEEENVLKGTYGLLIPAVQHETLPNDEINMESRRECMLKLLKQLEVFFNGNAAHGDMKPTNIMVELGIQKIIKGTKIYIIDFGLTTFPGSFSVNELGEGCFIFGTLNFVEGQDRTTIQDVESLAYILKYLATRKLKWMEAATKFNASRKRSTKSRRYKKIVKAKKNFPKEVNKAPEIPNDLKALIISLWTEAKDGNFTAARCRTYVQNFENYYEALTAAV